MIRPFARPVVSVVVSAALCLAQAPPAPAPATPAAAPAPTPVGALNLTNAPLLQVIDLLARDLHINYILDAKVKGGAPVTINTYGEVRNTDLRPILETILRMNGLAMVQVGNLYRIVPSADATRLPISPQVGLKDFPEDERMLLNLVFLKFMTAPEMEKILEPFKGESATVISYAPANLLLVEDNARNMKRTVELINLFDSDQFAGQRVQLFTTQNSRPSDLARELDTIFRAYALNEKTAAIRFLPIDRINTLLGVAANPGIFKEVDNWVKKLDIPVKLPAGSVSNNVYKLRYGRAEILGGVISQLYGGSASMGGLNSAYAGAGQRFGNTGYPGATNNSFGGGGFGMGGMNSSYGGGLGYGGAGTQFPTYVNPMATTAPVQPPSAMAGAFGTPAGTTGTAVAGAVPGAVPGATPDQTGSYLASGVTAFNGLPRIVPNPYDNTLLVQGTPQQWEQILRLLEQLDIPPRQVLIDARIYEVDLNDELKYGVEAALVARGAVSTAVPSLQLRGASGAGGFGLSAGAVVGQTRQLLGYLNSSDARGRTKVISAPSVIATDSIPASINVGQSTPTLAGVSPGLQNNGTTQFTQSISNQSSGVALNIIARVNASGVVTMVIDQSVTAPIPASQSANPSIDSPSFSQRQVSTQVTVEDGDTIAIGGIITEQNATSSNGVPGLNRIPYLGALFGVKSYTKQRTELIIFLTPRVIYDTNQITDATEELRQKVKNASKLDK